MPNHPGGRKITPSRHTEAIFKRGKGLTTYVLLLDRVVLQARLGNAVTGMAAILEG